MAKLETVIKIQDMDEFKEFAKRLSEFAERSDEETQKEIAYCLEPFGIKWQDATDAS